MTTTLTSNLPRELVLTSRAAFILSFLPMKLIKTDILYMRASCFSFVSNLRKQLFFATETINF